MNVARRAVHGAVMIESMVAFVLLALAGLVAARLQPQLHQMGEFGRQHSEALWIAQRDMEQLRQFAALMPSSVAAASASVVEPSYAAIAGSVAAATTPADGSATYTAVRRVASHGTPSVYKTATVQVGWTDRTGAAQQVELTSVVAAAEPALGSALRTASAGQRRLPYAGRSADIPLAAVDLGDGTSSLRLAEGSTIAVIFDNLTGDIRSVCADVSSTADRLSQHPAACVATAGLLLSGTVRFDLSPTPDPATAHATPLPFALQLQSPARAGTPTALCETEIAAAADRSDYRCVIRTTSSPPQWSGRITLVPIGWRIGTTAAERKVCRYSADADGRGRVDSNAEHPDTYVDVRTALVQQNFLVVRGDLPCPAMPTTAATNGLPDIVVNVSTIQQQP